MPILSDTNLSVDASHKNIIEYHIHSFRPDSSRHAVIGQTKLFSQFTTRKIFIVLCIHSFRPDSSRYAIIGQPKLAFTYINRIEGQLCCSNYFFCLAFMILQYHSILRNILITNRSFMSQIAVKDHFTNLFSKVGLLFVYK